MSKFFVLGLLLAAATLHADERYEVQFGRELQYRGGRVSVDHRFGSIQVTPGAVSKVVVKATIRSSDPDLGTRIRIIAVEAGNGVDIRTEYPEMNRRENLSFSVDYRIQVPPNAPVLLKNRFGSIDASGIGGPSVILNAHGSIRLRNARGAQTVENSFGSIDVSEAAGDTALVNANGSVRAMVIGGTLNVTNRFGSVTIEDAQRNAMVKNANGSVEVRDVDGAVSVTNSFATVRLIDVGGAVDVTNNNGAVEVRTTGGGATIRSSFGTVRADEVGGTATVVNSNGAVHLSGVRGDARVRTSFAPVFLKAVHGLIDVQNQNGAISISDPPSGPCREIVLRTSFAPIKVSLPSPANYAVTARTSFGTIKSDLPITTTTLGGENVVGTIGRGGCKLELTNANANITISKD